MKDIHPMHSRKHGRCKYCPHGTMRLAFPGPGDQKLLACDECRATCIEKHDGTKTDWRPGKKGKDGR